MESRTLQLVESFQANNNNNGRGNACAYTHATPPTGRSPAASSVKSTQRGWQRLYQLGWCCWEVVVMVEVGVVGIGRRWLLNAIYHKRQRQKLEIEARSESKFAISPHTQQGKHAPHIQTLTHTPTQEHTQQHRQSSSNKTHLASAERSRGPASKQIGKSYGAVINWISSSSRRHFSCVCECVCGSSVCVRFIKKFMRT